MSEVVKRCGTCKHAEFEKTSNGRINPQRSGKCLSMVAMLHEFAERRADYPLGLIGEGPQLLSIWADIDATECKKWEKR